MKILCFFFLFGSDFQLAKSGQIRPGLYAAMQSLYEKDKMFALQYVAAAENGSKISYRTPQEEDRRSQCSSKRIKGKQSITDKSAKFGPPDKNEHYITLPDSDDDFELHAPSYQESNRGWRENKRHSSGQWRWFWTPPSSHKTKRGWGEKKRRWSFVFRWSLVQRMAIMHHLILILGSAVSNFMTIVKLLKYPFQTRKWDYANSYPIFERKVKLTHLLYQVLLYTYNCWA